MEAGLPVSFVVLGLPSSFVVVGLPSCLVVVGSPLEFFLLPAKMEKIFFFAVPYFLSPMLPVGVTGGVDVPSASIFIQVCSS